MPLLISQYYGIEGFKGVLCRDPLKPFNTTVLWYLKGHSVVPYVIKYFEAFSTSFVAEVIKAWSTPGFTIKSAGTVNEHKISAFVVSECSGTGKEQPHFSSSNPVRHHKTKLLCVRWYCWIKKIARYGHTRLKLIIRNFPCQKCGNVFDHWYRVTTIVTKLCEFFF